MINRSALTLLLTILCFAVARAAEPPRPPNLVLILIDDFGYECVSANGGISYQTPHLDALATEGTRYEHCHAQPICTPSRVQLLTGRYNHRNYAGFGYLDPNERTFANELRDAGYATGIFGKWQLNGIGSNKAWDDTTRPGHFGFDDFLLWQLTHPRKDGERYPKPLLQNPAGVVRTSRDDYGPDLFLNAATDFIDRNQSKPFLLYYPMVLTHCPFWPTPDSPQWANPKKRTPGHSYKGSPEFFTDQVAYMDQLIGRLMQHLDERGLRDNTLVIVTGDNGTDQPIVSDMADGRRIAGGKGDTTFAGTHVPLIVSWPGSLPAGQVSQDLVDFSDIFPTLLEAAGTPPPGDRTLDGQSLLPRLRGDDGATARDHIFFHYWGKKGRTRKGAVSFVQDHRYKLYDHGDMFDLQTDPLEKQALSGHDDIRQRLFEALRAIDPGPQKP